MDQSAANPNLNMYNRKPKKKSSWIVPTIIVGAVVLVIVLMGTMFIGVVNSVFESDEVEVKSNTVLVFSVPGGIKEYSRQINLPIIGNPNAAGFLEIINAVRAAKYDNKIKGILIKPALGRTGFVKSLELLNELVEFKKSGKFIYAFIETGDESDYLITLAADSVFMQREGMMKMNGFGLANTFLKGFFDKIGVEFHVQQFEEFKSFAETYSKKKFSNEARMEISDILNARNKTFVEKVAEMRKMDVNTVYSLLARGIYTADSLQKNKLIDVIASETEMKDFLKEKIYGKNADKAKSKIDLLNIGRYATSGKLPKEKIDDNTKQIAIIYGVGTIQSGSTDNSFNAEEGVFSDTYISYLKKARENDRVKAIILRIDSPGGSVIASEAIWSEILKTKAVKPVYASMSDVAASGGYYMAMACDTIIASPMTITGSIGVILAIPNFSKLMNKLDITVDTVSTSPSAQFLNPLMSFKEVDKKQLYDLSYPVYRRFVEKVAESRKKSFEEARSVAKGRVWMGDQAMKHGLIDVEGDLQTAIDMAKARIGVQKDQKIRLDIYPKREDDISSILRLFGIKKGGSEDANMITKLASIYGMSSVETMAIWNSIPEVLRAQFKQALDITKIAQREYTIAIMPECFR
ncbi:MAG: signal peptide peptidase SppA [Candidatus Kapabacteria bacterium]|nr:signal peptide peptidase SppA [Candidatus Kapabacteria bacterium]